ncbi:MAG: Fic family protein [Bacteroidia bacterium]|nr:Fic family protein [Bacteroidia bacterium]
MSQFPPFLQSIDNRQQQIASHGDWDETLRKKVAYKFRLDWNYYSQSIEGGTLTRRETRTIMVGQVNVQGKPLKDVLEMTQHDEVIREIMAIGKGQKRLSEARIKQIHAAIMHEEDPEKRKLLGQWKTQPNEICNHKGEKREFTPPADVPDAIHDLLNRTNANWDKLDRSDKDARHPVLMALDFHLEFLSIHPFYDGNGRTARILLNLILIAFGYPAIIVKNEDKEAYGRYIAEIQGYGAGRELYDEFMSGLLIRSQELVLQALAGEDIEEPDDLDKEIELFQKQQEAKVRGGELVVYSHELFKTVTKDIILPFLEDLRIKAQKFDSLFLGKEETLELIIQRKNDRGNILPAPYHTNLTPGIKIDGEEILDLCGNDSCSYQLGLLYGDYRYDLQHAFSINPTVDLQFFRSNVTISLKIGLTDIFRREFPYAHLLRDGLPTKELAHIIIEAIFKEIKKQSEVNP